MKIDFTPIATLLWLGTMLLIRAQAQGVEQALLAAAVEWGARAVTPTVRLPRLRRRKAARIAG